MRPKWILALTCNVGGKFRLDMQSSLRHTDFHEPKVLTGPLYNCDHCSRGLKCSAQTVI